MNNPFFKKIVWAIDTMEPLEFQENAEFILKGLTRNAPAEVYPVYVCNQLSGPDAVALFEEAFAALSEKRMNELLEDSEINHLHKGTNLINDSYNVHSTVEVLLEYARENDADAIVTSTHSRGTVEKFFLGSFAETLLLQSEIPVITVNPSSVGCERISKVLLPSTFDQKFRSAFKRTVEFCAGVGASMAVFYKEPYIPMLKISYELLRLLESEAKMHKKEANWYVEWADKHRVALEIYIDSKPGKIAEAITSFAEEHAVDLIAMASQTPQFGPRIGSLCRKVVRRAECPVWTFRTDDYIKGEIES